MLKTFLEGFLFANIEIIDIMNTLFWRAKKLDVLLWKTCLNYLPLGWGSWLTNFVKYLCLMSEINQRSKLYLLLMKREILATILYFQGYLFWHFFSKQYQRIGWWDRLLLIFFIPTSRRTLAKRLSRYVISLLCFFCPTDKSIVNYDTPLLSLASKCKMDKKFFTKK